MNEVGRSSTTTTTLFPVIINIFLSAYIISNVRCGDITNAAFGNVVDGMPAAFGDFDSDELTDLFVIRNGKTVEILLGSITEPYFRVEQLRCDFRLNITSVVPGDFDGDALMDVLVTTINKTEMQATKKVITYVYVLWGGINHLNCTNDRAPPLIRMRDEPLAIDHNKNMTVDLFGVNEFGERGFWIFNKNRTEPEWKPMLTTRAPGPVQQPLRDPHSHAFLDLNGDNSPDLYLTGVYSYEVWLWDSELTDFVYSRNISFPPGVDSSELGQTLFMDMEIADKLEHVVPVCNGHGCKNSSIYVYSVDRWYNIDVSFLNPKGKLCSFANDNKRYTNTISLRGGDFNMDGYPDLLVTLQCEDEKRSYLLENVPCAPGACGGFSRKFEIQWNAFSVHNSDTVMGTFYDFLQDGILDIIFVHYYRERNVYRVSAFKNSLDYDANFIKVMVITGLTNNEIELPPTILGTKRHTFGTNLPGPKISYKTTTQEGTTRAGVSAQLPQSAHFSLNLPFTIFGLGRTPNFVEDLIVGMFNESRSWSQIIPNSQVVVIPYPPDKPYAWRTQLFVTPSKIILQSVLALLGVCLIIVLIIALLHWKERREDKIEKLQEAHRFHFDAM